MIKNKNIMIVSNEPEVHSLLGKNLKERGYDVFNTDESGDRLKEIINTISPDLIIIFIKYPVSKQLS